MDKLTIFLISIVVIETVIIIIGIFFWCRKICPERHLLKKLTALIKSAKNFSSYQSASSKADNYISALSDMIKETTLNNNEENKKLLLNQQAQLLTLQNQINPHFLYNCLETIRGEMIIRDNLDVAEMTEKLARFFRYNISRKGNIVKLREETENLENYVAIQKYRFGDRVNYNSIINCGETTFECLIPKLTLQPLVENAILHGIDSKLDGGTITLTIDATNKHLILTISDDGVGIDTSTLDELRSRLNTNLLIRNSTPASGIALTNINQRLRTLFGGNYSFSIMSTLGVGTDVIISIPLVFDENELS